MTQCPSFDELGECRHGYKCRFLGGHIQAVKVDGADTTIRLELKANAARKMTEPYEHNGVDTSLLKSLRKREVSVSSKMLVYFPLGFGIF